MDELNGGLLSGGAGLGEHALLLKSLTFGIELGTGGFGLTDRSGGIDGARVASLDSDFDKFFVVFPKADGVTEKLDLLIKMTEG